MADLDGNIGGQRQIRFNFNGFDNSDWHRAGSMAAEFDCHFQVQRGFTTDRYFLIRVNLRQLFCLR